MTKKRHKIPDCLSMNLTCNVLKQLILAYVLQHCLVQIEKHISQPRLHLNQADESVWLCINAVNHLWNNARAS